MHTARPILHVGNKYHCLMNMLFLFIPGQYLQNICDPRQPGCVPCEERYPSCRGLVDGKNAYPGLEVSKEYIICQEGRTISTVECPSGFYNPNTQNCGSIYSEGK